MIITTWRVFTYLADGVVTTYDWLSFGLFYLVSVLFAALLIAMLIRSQYIITDKQIILQFGLIKTKYEIKDIFSIHRFQGENKLAVYFDDFKTKYAVIVVKDIWYDDFVKTLISRKPGLSFSFSTAEEEEQYKHDNDRRHKNEGITPLFFALSVVLGVRLEEERHQEGEYDGSGYSRARRRKRTRERPEEAALRPLHRAVCKQIPEPADGDRRPSARKLDERLIEAEGGQYDAREHKDDEDLAGSQVGEIDDHLRRRADEPSHRECL